MFFEREYGWIAVRNESICLVGDAFAPGDPDLGEGRLFSVLSFPLLSVAPRLSWPKNAI